MPNIENYDSSTAWQTDFYDRARKTLQSEESGEYREKLKKFTENQHLNSEKVEIPKLSLPFDDSKEQENYQKIIEIAQQILEKFKEGGKSRILLISDEREQGFYDAHTTIILGPTKKGDDLLVLEKVEVGKTIQVKKLSEVISDYSYSWQIKNPRINICESSFEEMYPVN
jgi:hypothetical protein